MSQHGTNLYGEIDLDEGKRPQVSATLDHGAWRHRDAKSVTTFFPKISVCHHWVHFSFQGLNWCEWVVSFQSPEWGLPLTIFKSSWIDDMSEKMEGKSEGKEKKKMKREQRERWQWCGTLIWGERVKWGESFSIDVKRRGWRGEANERKRKGGWGEQQKKQAFFPVLFQSPLQLLFFWMFLTPKMSLKGREMMKRWRKMRGIQNNGSWKEIYWSWETRKQEKGKKVSGHFWVCGKPYKCKKKQLPAKVHPKLSALCCLPFVLLNSPIHYLYFPFF